MNDFDTNSNDDSGSEETTSPPARKRPAKGEQREPASEKRLDRQVRQSAEEAIGELPVLCDRGTKKNAKGYKTSWNGYKLHLDTNDIGLPVSALVTSASLHDSQAAIPLKAPLNAGYRITREPPYLRHFRAELEPISR